MDHGVVDLRSDTVTKPTPEMRRAMANAEVGDDHYGEDPTVRALEESAAELFAHESAVFVPSGSMGNLIGLRLLATPGSEILADTDSHVVTYEMGSLAAIGGIQTRTLTSEDGILSPEALAAAIRADGDETDETSNYAMVTTRAVAIENTHVFSGGRAWRLDQIDALRSVTASKGVSLHCDGARIWNAAVATGTSLSDYGKRFDTLSVCLSKGLGAPVGSLLITSAERARRARSMRRQLGGGMRQAGIIAAGGLYALKHHFERLADDHRRADVLASALAEIDPSRLPPHHPETNIVLFKVADADQFVSEAQSRGVLVGALSSTTVRAVTHLDVDDRQLHTATAELRALFAQSAP